MYSYNKGKLTTKKGEFLLSQIDFINAEWKNWVIAKQKRVVLSVDGKDFVIDKAITADRVSELNRNFQNIVDDLNEDKRFINIGGQTYVNMAKLKGFGKYVSTPEGDYYYLKFNSGNVIYRYHIDSEVREVIKDIWRYKKKNSQEENKVQNIVKPNENFNQTSKKPQVTYEEVEERQ